jgi:YVTN family beta-propeller protein
VAIEVDDLLIDDACFPGRQGRLLFACLATQPRRLVPRDEIAQVLWGDAPPPTRDKALTVLASKLRTVLADAGLDGARALTSASGCYRLELPAHATVDVLVAASAVRDAEAALADGDLTQASQEATTAEVLTRSTFLPGDSGEWVDAQRRELSALRWRAIHALGEATLRSGRPHQAAGWAEQAVALEPFRESAYRLLMQAHAANGNRAEGLRVYDRCRRLLEEELGASPSPETDAVYRRLLAEDVPGPVADPVAARGDRPEPERVQRVVAAPAAPTRSSTSRRAVYAAIAASALTATAVAVSLTRPDASGAGPVVAPNSVVAIDVGTNKPAGHVVVGSRPGAIAFGSEALWVANQDDQTVTRVDPRSLLPQRTILAGGVPTAVASTGSMLWVAVTSPTTNFVAVRQIDPQYNSVTRTVRVPTLVAGTAAAVSFGSGGLWVAPRTGELTYLNPTTGRVLRRVDPNASPSAVATDGAVTWVTDSTADNVTRLDPTGLIAPIAVGHNPSGIAVGEGGVWVADTGDDAVVRIDPVTQAVTTTIPVGKAPTGLAVGAGAVWVANSGDGTVMRIDPRSARVEATIRLGHSPQQVAVVGRRAWVTVAAEAISSRAAIEGGTARMVSREDVDSLDPALAFGALSWELLHATCAKLLTYHADSPRALGSELVPEVARSLPTRSADGRTYTFTIRRGFRFSPPSSEEITAQTVKDTIERTLSPGMRSPSGPPVADEFDDIVGARAFTAGRARHIAGILVRRDTLTVRLTAPAPDLLSRLAQPFFCIVPSSTPIDPRGVRLIPSAGPYYVSSYVPGQGVVLTRNPNYPGSRPHSLGRIELRVGVGGPTAVRQVESGAADYAVDGEIDSALTASLARRYGPGSPAALAGHQQYFVSPLPATDFLVLNTRRGPFTDVQLRRALNYAIDRAALARTSGHGPAQPSDDYLPPGVPGRVEEPIYPSTPDLSAARRLARGHAGETVTLYTCGERPCRQQAEIIKHDLARIGLRTVVKAFNDTLYTRLVTPREPFDIGVVGYSADYLDPDDFLNLVLESGMVVPRFDDTTYTARLAAAKQLSGRARYLTYREIDRDLIRDAAPWVVFDNPSSHELFSARMGCQVYGPFGLDLAALCLRATRG